MSQRSMHLIKRKLSKRHASVSILLLLAVMGTLYVFTGRDVSGVLYAFGDETCRLPALSLERLAPRLPFGSTYKSNRYLFSAENRLTEVARLRAGNLPLEECLMHEYIENISRALEELRKIQPNKSTEVFLSGVLRRLASHQAILRGIRQRSLQPLSVEDVARGANMRVQKRLVEHIANNETSYLPQEVKTNTGRLLVCPGCNVIIVSLTTLRKDHIGLYGYDRLTTPHIDEFFKNSLVFENAFAPTSWTLPNAISLFTSLFPYTHGIITRDYVPDPVFYNEKIPTFAELLSRHGYRTAAFSGGGDYNRQFSGLDRGFDYYLDEMTFADHDIEGKQTLGGPKTRLFYARIKDVLEPGLEWLQEHSKEKFFFFVQGYDTHCPLYPREPYASRFTTGLKKSSIDFSVCHWTYQDTFPEYEKGEAYWKARVPVGAKSVDGSVLFSQSDIEYMRSLYDARIAETDDLLGMLFSRIKTLGLEKNTIVILMSEHGEMLGENGWFMRGAELRGSSYDLVLNIPLLIKHPAIEETVIINDPVQMVDIMPTLLQLLGIEDTQSNLREGNVLAFSVFGDHPTNEYAYAGTMYFPTPASVYFNKANASSAIRGTEWKLIKNTVFQDSGLVPESVSYKLYNITDDPYENNNLYEREPETAADLQNKLEQWLQRYYTAQ